MIVSRESAPSEAFTIEQLPEFYDVNVLGTQRVNRAVLPIMRKQGKGLFIDPADAGAEVINMMGDRVGLSCSGASV